MRKGLVKLELVGALRYGYKSEKFERNTHYLVKPERAKLLLRLTTDNGYKVFREIGKPFSPVVERAVKPEAEVARFTVDTTKSEEDQFEDMLTEAEGKSAATTAVVDMSDGGITEEAVDDIEEEEGIEV